MTSAVQLVQGDRKIAHTLTGCVIDRIGDGCSDTYNTDLA
jgi:hypothetical protein